MYTTRSSIEIKINLQFNSIQKRVHRSQPSRRERVHWHSSQASQQKLSICFPLRAHLLLWYGELGCKCSATAAHSPQNLAPVLGNRVQSLLEQHLAILFWICPVIANNISNAQLIPTTNTDVLNFSYLQLITQARGHQWASPTELLVRSSRATKSWKNSFVVMKFAVFWDPTRNQLICFPGKNHNHLTWLQSAKRIPTRSNRMQEYKQLHDTNVSKLASDFIAIQHWRYCAYTYTYIGDLNRTPPYAEPQTRDMYHSTALFCIAMSWMNNGKYAAVAQGSRCDNSNRSYCSPWSTGVHWDWTIEARVSQIQRVFGECTTQDKTLTHTRSCLRSCTCGGAWNHPKAPQSLTAALVIKNFNYTLTRTLSADDDRQHWTLKKVF